MKWKISCVTITEKFNRNLKAKLLNIFNSAALI